MCNSGDPDIEGDRLNILLLIGLYTLQYIPRGLSMAIPIILQNRGSSYSDQAEFSFTTYSYCFKLLWAPLVDCVYSNRIGRRKTWLVPTQYLIGVLLMLISLNVENWLGSEDGTRKSNIHLLTITFFVCILFASTQDIVVDGWSLTLLQKRNVGYAGTCNLIGYVFGQFLGYVLFIVLDSKEFSNKFRSVPQDYGLVGFSDFIFFWSIVIMVATSLVFLFKKEDKGEAIVSHFECRHGLRKSYRYLWQILTLGPIQTICIIFLTCEIGFGPVNGVARLKLIDAGVPQYDFALLTLPSLPLIIILPFAVSRYMTGHQSMRTFIGVYILKSIFGIVYAVLILVAPCTKNSDGILPTWFYWILIFVYNFENIDGFFISRLWCVRTYHHVIEGVYSTLVDHIMIITVGAFFCRISDPRYGGMYLTLFNTMSNIGHGWPVSVSLWLVDSLTIRYGGEFNLVIDGYYVEIILFTTVGLLWLRWGKKEIYKLEHLDISTWILEKNLDQRKRVPSHDNLSSGE